MNIALPVVAIVVILLISCIFVVWFLLRDKAGASKKVERGQSASSPAKPSEQSTFSSLKVAALALFGCLVARIGYMQLLNDSEYSEQAEKNRTRTQTIQAPRGRILDRNGTELVTNRPTLALLATKDLISDAIEMRLLANLLGMPYDALMWRLNLAENNQTLHVVAQDLTEKQVAFISEHPEVFPDVTVSEQTSRQYVQGTLAAHVIGYISEATQDQIKAQKDAENPLQAGDLVGQAGIEAQYDDILRGVDGEQKVYVSADGSVEGVSETLDPTAGSDVILTIDAKIQKAAEDGLAKAVSVAKEAKKPATAAALVCLDAQSGDVLALASYPTYSPQAFSGGISSEDWDQLSNESSNYPLLNRAVSGMYPSASTIKPLASLAGLDAGVVNSSSQFDCVGFWTGFGKESGQWCWNHNGHGWLNLRSGIINSCNTVFYEIGKGIFYSEHPEALQEEYYKWGLGSASHIDLPSEAEGRIPTPEWKASYYAEYPGADTTWYGGDTTNIAIGQGDILVTPLQMACVYAGLATDGSIYRPHVLKGIGTKDGMGTISEYTPSIEHQVTPDSEHLRYVKEALSQVVYEEDPAVAAHFASLPVKVSAKTGTAEQAGKEPSGWFCCYAPSDDPHYVIACVVEQGGFGASSAMYAVRDTLGGIYNTPDTSNAVSTNTSM